MSSVAIRQTVGKLGRVLAAALVLGAWLPSCPFLDCGIPPRKIKVMTSVFPLQEFARAVAGEEAEVNLLLPPGAGIHSWQPRPSDLVKLSAADLFIYIGARLEPWADDILRSLAGRQIHSLEVAAFLPLMESPEEGSHGHAEDRAGLDPHVWLDFEYDQAIIRRIQEILSELDPANASRFRENAESYIARLAALDRVFRQELSPCPRRIFVVGGHAAFGYLAKRYGLRQVSLYGLSPDSEPTPGQMIEIINLARQEGIKHIYFESNVSPKLARVLAKEIHASTLTLNPGHNITKEEAARGMTFLQLMEDNLVSLKKGLCDE